MSVACDCFFFNFIFLGEDGELFLYGEEASFQAPAQKRKPGNNCQTLSRLSATVIFFNIYIHSIVPLPLFLSLPLSMELVSISISYQFLYLLYYSITHSITTKHIKYLRPAQKSRHCASGSNWERSLSLPSLPRKVFSLDSL